MAIPKGGITDRNELRAWLEALPEDKRLPAARLIAVKAAQMALPFVVGVFSVDRLAGDKAVALTIATLRATLISRLARKYPSREMMAAASAANAAYAARAAAVDAAYAAAAFAASAAFAAFAAYAAYAAYAADAAAASAANAAVWQNITTLARQIGRGENLDALLDAPLWPDDVPDWWSVELTRFSNTLSALDDGNWSDWVDWFRPISEGHPAWGLPRQTAEQIELKIALGDDRKDFWNRKPQEINAEIAEWVAAAKAAEKLTPPPQGSGLQFELFGMIIRLARGLGLANTADDQAQIDTQLPILLRLVKSLEKRLKDDEASSLILLQSIERLRWVLERQDHAVIGVTELYTETMIFRDQLDQAEKATLQSNIPSFSGSDLATAKSIATIADMIVLATAEGRHLFDDADRSNLDAGEQEKYRVHELRLLELMGEHGAIMDPETLRLLHDAVLAETAGPMPVRGMHLSAASVRNALVLLSGIGTLGGIGYALLSVPAFTVSGAALAYLVKTILGKPLGDTIPGKALNDAIKARINRPTVEFVLKNKRLLRNIAGDRRGYRWLNDMIDEIEKAEEAAKRSKNED
jgi:hypothetical protein